MRESEPGTRDVVVYVVPIPARSLAMAASFLYLVVHRHRIVTSSESEWDAMNQARALAAEHRAACWVSSVDGVVRVEE